MRISSTLARRLPLAVFAGGSLHEADVGDLQRREAGLARAATILQRQRLPGEAKAAFMAAAERELTRASAPAEVTNEAPIFARFSVLPPGTIRWRALALELLLQRATR